MLKRGINNKKKKMESYIDIRDKILFLKKKE